MSNRYHCIIFVVCCAFAGAVATDSEGVLAQEIELGQPGANGAAVNDLNRQRAVSGELPQALTFEELETPHINPTLVPQTDVVSIKPDTVTNPPVVKPQPAVRAAVPVNLPLPAAKVRQPVIRVNFVTPPVPVRKPQVPDVVISEIPPPAVSQAPVSIEPPVFRRQSLDDADRR